MTAIGYFYLQPSTHINTMNTSIQTSSAIRSHKSVSPGFLADMQEHVDLIVRRQTADGSFRMGPRAQLSLARRELESLRGHIDRLKQGLAAHSQGSMPASASWRGLSFQFRSLEALRQLEASLVQLVASHPEAEPIQARDLHSRIAS